MKRTAIILTAILIMSVVTLTASSEVTYSSTSSRMTKTRDVSLILQSNHEFTSQEILNLQSVGNLTTVAGRIAVIHTDTGKATELRKFNYLSKIQRPQQSKVYLDKSVAETGADRVWNEIKDFEGRNLTGNGIIIGFVDTGIDTTHPDFTLPNGRTKILYVWDQSTSGRPPTDFGYGSECSSEDIESMLCLERDSFGHGTHVAGIAASSGRSTGNYAGVAPGASIIFVKSGHEMCNGASWTFDNSQILDGMNYIVKRSSQLGKRAVINLSLGGNMGAHDGTDPLEQGLDAFVQNGTPVVVAAGNSALDNDHASGRLSSGSNVTLNLSVQKTTTNLQVDVWFSPRDKLTGSITFPDGEVIRIPTSPEGSVNKYGTVTTVSTLAENGNELFFDISSTTELPSTGWRITLSALEVNSNGVWDAWIDTVTCSFPGASFQPGNGYNIDTFDTIGIPGTAKYAITVGAYITKTSWRGFDGQTKNIGGNTGGITRFSSLGPTRDGRIKPDLVAPGLLIASAKSSALPGSESNPDSYHRMLAGTSMAAPHVAGAIALILQYAPGLPATELPRILRQTARLDSNTGLPAARGSQAWGFGKLDVRTATGFFRLTMIPHGLDKNIRLAIRVQNNDSLNVTGESWTDIYSHEGTTLTVKVDRRVEGLPGVRYSLNQNGDLKINSNMVIFLNYTVQYLLTVNPRSSLIEPQWYDANSKVKLTVPALARITGILEYIGAEYVQLKFVNEKGEPIENSVVMDKPRTITAMYETTYPIQTIVALAGFTLAVTLSLLLLKIRGTSKKRSRSI